MVIYTVLHSQQLDTAMSNTITTYMLRIPRQPSSTFELVGSIAS